ncbi:MAG TPA: alpha/beta hydrolase [Ktedonobacteraceae bacterium]|nr:alpha/beta hydrolase [Ktedonobacteraceae bacterium]
MRFSLMHSSTRATSVVLVHGLAVSSRYMVPTALHLAPFYDVYLPDLPGFGKSANPSSVLSIPALADALADWMQVIGLPPSVLLGNSLGCQIIIHLALHHSQLLTHAVLVSPTMDPQTRNICPAALRLARDLPEEPWSFLPVLAREYFDAGFGRTLRTLHFAFADHMEEHISSIQIPTLIVRGSRDPLVGQEWVEELHRLLPTSQLLVVQGAGHAVNFNSPEKLAYAVRSFLSCGRADP